MTTSSRVPQKGTITADATIGPINIDVDPHRNTPLTLFADGTFGGGTLKVQVSPSGSVTDAIDLASVSLSAAGYHQFPLIQGTFFLVMSGSTSPSVKWWIQ